MRVPQLPILPMVVSLSMSILVGLGPSSLLPWSATCRRCQREAR